MCLRKVRNTFIFFPQLTVAVSMLYFDYFDAIVLLTVSTHTLQRRPWVTTQNETLSAVLKTCLCLLKTIFFLPLVYKEDIVVSNNAFKYALLQVSSYFFKFHM